MSIAAVPRRTKFLDATGNLARTWVLFFERLGEKLGLVRVTDRGVQIAPVSEQLISDFLYDQLSVKMFGAVGDGITDDTDAMVKAFRFVATSGGSLFVPPGTYIVDPAGTTANTPLLAIGSNMRIHGTGTIKVKDKAGDYASLLASPFTISQEVHNLVIEGITIDQNVLANTSSAISVPTAATTAQVAIAVNGDIRGITIRGVTIFASGINTISVNSQGADDVSISDCTFYWQKRTAQAGFDNSAIYFANGLPRTGVVNTAGTAVTWVSGDVFTPTQIGRGIEINGVSYVVFAYVDSHHVTLSATAGTQTGVPYTNPQKGRVSVRDCVWFADWNDHAVTAIEVHDCTGDATGNHVTGYQVAQIVYNVSDFTVRGNVGRSLLGGCGIWSQTGYKTSRLTITGNVWSLNNADRGGFDVSAGVATAFSTGNNIEGDFEDLDISNNTVEFQPSSATNAGFFLNAGISLCCEGNVTNAKIYRNLILNSPIRGIKIGSSEANPILQPIWQKRIYVDENVIIDAGNNQDATGHFYCAAIWASGNLEDVGIRRNRITDTGTPRYGPTALRIDNTGGFTFTRVFIGQNTAVALDGTDYPNLIIGTVGNDDAVAVRTVSAAGTYTPVFGDYVILADTSSNDVVIDFPTSLPAGQILIVKKVAAAHVVFTSTSQIDGEVRVLVNKNEVIAAQWDGAVWRSIVSTRMADMRYFVRSVSASTTVTGSDNTILADTTAGNVIVNLPAAGLPPGQIITVKKLVAANAVFLGTTAVDGAIPSLTERYAAITVQWDGTSYHQLAEFPAGGFTGTATVRNAAGTGTSSFVVVNGRIITYTP